jgi:uncharacterized protein YjbI with pentapeptide repeats
MEGAWFNLAHMERTSFIYVHMERVIFLGAYMEGASFNGAQLERADFSNAVGLTVEQFRSAKGWEQAVFDPAFRRELKAAKEKKYAAEPPSGEQQKGPPR